MYLLILRTKSIKNLVIYFILTTLTICFLAFLKITGTFYHKYVLLSFLLIQFFIGLRLIIMIVRSYKKKKGEV